MESINTIIAVIALLISIVALIFTYKQKLLEMESQFRRDLAHVIATFGAFSNLCREMKRERGKTGKDIDIEENEIFVELDELCQLQNKIKKDIQKHLAQEHVKVDTLLLSQALDVKNQTTSMTHAVELMFERFKRFNDNKVAQLKEQLEEIQLEHSELKPSMSLKKID